MDTYLECRTCLGKFTCNDIIHVETKMINQKNVLQAIEEVASIKVLENDGLPEHICKVCFKSLESSVTFRIQIISSENELKRRLCSEIPIVNSNDLLQLSGKIEKKEDNDDLYVKEENKEFNSLVEKRESILSNEHIQSDNYASPKILEESEDDWNDFGEAICSSDDKFQELNKKSSLRQFKNTRKKDKASLFDGNLSDGLLHEKSKEKALNCANKAVKQKNDTDFNDTPGDLTSKKPVKESPKTKLFDQEWSDSSDDSKSSDHIFIENRNKNSNKNSTLDTRKVRRKRRVTRKPIKDISDTSSDSDSDSDIPLGELRKEIKDLENKVEPKVRKKREKKEQADGPRLCPICGKLFKARQNFNSHMTTVHRKKPDKPEKISCLCPDCGRVISGTRQNFVAHRRYHHSDKAQVKKRFTCDVCPRKFYREKNLIIHQRIHKGEKGYVCELCPDKSYTQIGGLILHKRKVHLKKPTCTCNYCGKQFYEKHYLETHIRQWHTGERPFSCEICGKSFSCNGTLLRHRKDSHGEKQPCPKCGKMYTEGELRKHLKRHKIREEGIKRKKYTCEYCGTEMNFTSRKRHLLKQHGIMLRGRGETAERVPISRADAM